jgi:HEPN domain-containing protein
MKSGCNSRLKIWGVAKTLLKTTYFSSVAYHSQQSAEKALKGYLIFKKQEILKTHDLIKLVGLCAKLDANFAQVYDIAEHLNPFATKFRYPTEFDIPDAADAKSAFQQARKIVAFVVKKISQPEIGQTSLF